MNLYDELKYRGFIDNITSDQLIEKLNTKSLCYYIGFDPSADSFHIGQYAVFNLMRILSRHGHKTIALMGGATGMIGDPSGKNKERNLLDEEQLQHNISRLEEQFKKFLDFSSSKTIILNNHDWLGKFSFLDFLRDVGKNFSVNTMIARDSVSSRLNREGEGITFTEFSYMILQAYDFYYINKNYDCSLQVGGSDQWGNIVSGIDLTRRLSGNEVYGLTIPLVTKSDGTKFGKSEGQAIWLSADKTPPYDLYQFLVRQSDEDVIKFLKVLTTLDKTEIESLEESVRSEPHLRRAQKRLAQEVVSTLHGEDVLAKILKAVEAIYSSEIVNIDAQLIQDIFRDSPSFEIAFCKLDEGWQIINALAESGLCDSKSKARKLIESGGFYLNNEKQTNVDINLTRENLLKDRFMVFRSGKKNYMLIKAH